MTIPGVQYGSAGAFTIVLWARFGLMTGNAMGYIYSHNATEDTQAALDPNQVGTRQLAFSPFSVH